MNLIQGTKNLGKMFSAVVLSGSDDQCNWHIRGVR